MLRTTRTAGTAVGGALALALALAACGSAAGAAKVGAAAGAAKVGAAGSSGSSAATHTGGSGVGSSGSAGAGTTTGAGSGSTTTSLPPTTTTTAPATTTTAPAPATSTTTAPAAGAAGPVLITAAPDGATYRGRRPGTIDFSLDATNIVSHLTWSSWGPTRAVGRGTLSQDNCTPNCAQGTVTEVAATLTLSGVQSGHFTVITEAVGGRDQTFHYPALWPAGAH